MNWVRPEHCGHGQGEGCLGEHLALPAVLGVLLQHLDVHGGVEVELEEGGDGLDVAHGVDDEDGDAGGDVGEAADEDHAEAEAELEPEGGALDDDGLDVHGEHEVVDEVAGHHEGAGEDHGGHAVGGDHQQQDQRHAEGQRREVERHGGCW